MSKIALSLAGALAGLVFAYAVRPTNAWNIRPNVGEIIATPHLWDDFLIYSGGSAMVGLMIGMVVDQFFRSK